MPFSFGLRVKCEADVFASIVESSRHCRVTRSEVCASSAPQGLRCLGAAAKCLSHAAHLLLAFISKTFAIQPLSAPLINLSGGINEIFNRRHQCTESRTQQNRSRIRQKQVRTAICTAITISIEGRHHHGQAHRYSMYRGPDCSVVLSVYLHILHMLIALGILIALTDDLVSSELWPNLRPAEPVEST